MGSRFVGLSVGDFGPNEPGPSGTQPPASPVPQTQEPTRPTSPTPTLQPYVGPTTWTWGETEYDTLEEAILASMTEHDMPEKLRGWYISIVRDLTRREIVDLYNLLGNKMYEHRAEANTAITQLRTQYELAQKAVRELRGKADVAVASAKLATDKVQTLEAENVALKAEITSLKADHDVLNTNVLLVVEKYKELAAKVNNVVTHPPAGSAPITISAQAPTASKVKASEPPKFKGNKGSDITLEQWLQKMGLWFRIQNVTADDDRITLALMYLEGGALDFVSDYVDNASEGFALGSWSDFVDRLKAGYRQLAPEKTAQASLEEWCTKIHPSVIQFAENFRRFASKSGYSNVELIRRIDHQISRDVQIQTVMATTRQINPDRVPLTWDKYLDWALTIEMDMRGNKLQASSTSRPAPRKDPNAMDIDNLRKPEKLSKEQAEWLEKKLCFRCGKHPYKSGQRCRNPKYNGYYELPEGKDNKKTGIHALEENKMDESAKWDYLCKALAEFAAQQDKGKGRQEEPETTARIEEIRHTEEDFLSRML